MKITLRQNPLHTCIEVDEHEKRVIQLHHYREKYEDMLFWIHDRLERSTDLEKTKEAILEETKNLYEDNEEEFFEKRYYEILRNDCHGGDCTAFACSCWKCMAEEALGFYSIPNSLSKGAASKIDGAFEGRGTAAEALDYLINNPPTVKDPWQHHYIERWLEQHQEAIDYLKEHIEKLKVQEKESL